MPVDPFIGEIMVTSWVNLNPRGFVECKGQLLQINEFQALYSLLGTTYGGDGRVTFGIPDLQGRVPVGSGQGAGLSLVTPGARFSLPYNVLTEGQLAAHDHTVSIPAQDAALAGSATGPINASGAAADKFGPANKWLGQTAQGVQEQIYTDTGTPAVAMGMTATVDLSTGLAVVPAQELSTGATGSNDPIENHPPSLGLRFFIAVDGTYPSRN